MFVFFFVFQKENALQIEIRLVCHENDAPVYVFTSRRKVHNTLNAASG